MPSVSARSDRLEMELAIFAICVASSSADAEYSLGANNMNSVSPKIVLRKDRSAAA